MSQFSRHTIAEYLPEIKGVCAAIEVELTAHPDLDRRTELRPYPAMEQYGEIKARYAMMLIDEWLKGTPFSVRIHFLQKNDPSASWTDMLKILNAKILEYQNDVPVIVLNLSRTGRIARTVDGTIFEHEFESDGFKKEVLFILLENGGYVQTKDLRQRTGSKSTESIAKTIAVINNVLRAKLQLPAKGKVIESKRASGYRLNPLYNIVITN